MLLLLSLLAAAPPADTLSLPWPPVQRVEPAALVVHRQPAVPVVALRLSLLTDDPPGYAGAGHLVQHLVFPTLQEQVARVGGRAQMLRTTDAVIYTVAGPAVELESLAAALKRTLYVPEPINGNYLTALRDLREERLAEWETAQKHVRATLRATLFPADLSAAGTAASAERLTRERVVELWRRMYRPERVAIVAVGDTELRRVREAFADLPPAVPLSDAPARQDTTRLPPPSRAETTSGWVGVGYDVSDLEPAAVSVTARLVAADLRRRLPRASVETEHWWTHQGQGLVVTAAAPPPTLDSVRVAMRDPLAGIGARVTAREVSAAARDLRRDLLFHARTPLRTAELIGTFVDRGGDPGAAQRYYAELDAVDVAAVRAVLTAAARGTPARVELPPQRPAQPAVSR